MQDRLEYEIRVNGVVPESVLVEMEGLHAVSEPVQTVLWGPVVDQAALRGIIDRLQRLGLELIDVHQITRGPDAGSGRIEELEGR